jgi:hypothetical protein
MKLSISTWNGVSKAVYNGLTLSYLTESELETLRAEIWVALQEMDLARDLAAKYEAEAV